MSTAIGVRTWPARLRDDASGMHAVLADCLAIAREVHLSGLLTLVMEKALTWTGAELGCVALDRGDGWVVEVEGRADRRPLGELRPIRLEDTDRILQQIIRHVARTGRAFEMHSAVEVGRFVGAADCDRERPHSVRCVPLLDSAGRMFAAVYLENCDAARAESADSSDRLGLLAPHIAAALETARRVRSLERQGGAPDVPRAAGESSRRGWDGAISPSDRGLAALPHSANQLPDIALMRAHVERASAEAERAQLRALLVQAESTEARLRGLLEAAPDAIVMTTADGCIARVNRQTELLFGYTRGDLIGQPVEVLMPERYHRAHVDQRARYAATPRFRPMGRGLQLVGRRRDGSEFPVEVSLSWVTAPAGIHILSAIRDVSERRAAEQALQESERSARATIDALPEHICVLDERGVIVSTNAAWTAFAAENGADPALTGKGTNYLAVCNTATGPEGSGARAFADGIRAVMRGERDSCTTEYTCHAPDERRWFIARATRFPGEGPTRIVIAHENVTERKLAELELRAAKEAAVLAERGRLGRELHDSVTQAIFSASLIAGSLPQVWERAPDDGRRGLEEVRQLTRGALAEMRTLLFELRPAALLEKKLGDLFRQLAEAMSSRTGVSVEVAAQEDGGPLPPDVHVEVYRIVQEALNNVAKHAEARCVSVRVRTTKDRVIVRVLDDGCGFEVAALPRGQLGLGIMQERARSIGAQLKIVSRPGRGTIVAVAWQSTGRELSDARA